jgi:hypothetical protein
MALTKITSAIIADGAITASAITDTSITADKLHTTLDLTGKSVTVATATAGDNDTTVASTAFVSTAIANLADSAPETLNTLNELAAALGDDANFSTTVTNSIALKAPLASPDFTGDATFDTSTLVIDSTNNRVGIGTTSPLSTMHLSTTGGGSVYLQDSDATSTYNISEISNNAGNFGIQTRNSSGTFVSTDYQIVKNASGADYHRWFTQGSERMRIDSSGNLLVGKTAVGVGNAGIELRANNLAAVSRSGDNVLYLNRISNDGSILELRKDNVVAGNIGTYVGYPYIGKGDTTLLFNPDGDRIIPRGTNAAQRDAAIDLGGTSDRFKDLYLSGTASIGNLTIAGAQGTDGQVLTSTGSGIAWEDAASGGSTDINGLSDAKTFGTGSIMLGDTTTGTLSNANYNVGVGVDMLNSLTSGYANIAIGFESCKDLTTGHNNVAVGHATLYENIGGEQNVAVGANALQNNTEGDNNVAIGKSALVSNTASNNTAVGWGALKTTTTATQVTALGYRAGEDSTGSSSTFIGFLAGAETSTGNQNTFIGASTAESGVCTGTSNTAVGGNNFTHITTGSYNCVMGTHAMRNFQTGEGNVVLGYNAKRLHSSGDDAVVIGNHAGYNMTTGRSVVVGNEAFYDGTSTDDSVFIGNQAGYNVTTGYTNIIIGDRAGDTTLTTGYSNVIIGYKAGRSTNGFANTFVGSGAGTSSAGSYNTCIGNGANFGNANNGGIIIGYGGSAGAAGTYATLAYGGNKSWISLGATGWSGSSDKRLKENIRPSEAGLSFINDLKPVNFDWRKKKDIDPELETHKSDSDERYEKDNPTGKIGFIAQDVKEALDNHPEVISHLWEEQEDGTQALTPNELIPMLVKAVQELSAKVEELQNG